MKRILSLILALALILSLAACAAPASEPIASAEPTNASQTEPVIDKPTEMPADEYERAVWYGFLPDGLATADPDGTSSVATLPVAPLA